MAPRVVVTTIDSQVQPVFRWNTGGGQAVTLGPEHAHLSRLNQTLPSGPGNHAPNRRVLQLLVRPGLVHGTDPFGGHPWVTYPTDPAGVVFDHVQDRRLQPVHGMYSGHDLT